MAIGPFGGFDVAFRQGTADEKVIAHSFDNDIFLNGVPEYRPARGDVVMDIGAHIGTFSMLVARQATEGRVFAIEASSETYNYLRTNVALNNLKNITADHLAMGGSDGTVRLHHDRKNWGHTIMTPLSSRGESVAMQSLATYMQRNAISQCDFIKFNCEGAEFPILMSAPDDVLARVRRMLVLYHTDLATEYTREALAERLSAAGFSLDFRNVELNDGRGWIYAYRGA